MIFLGSKSLDNDGGRAGFLQRARQRCGAFGRDETGSLIVFTLFLFVVMLMVGGIAVDTIRHETTRAKMQYTIDRAVLAAADLDQTLGAQEVVDDYFAKAGLGAYSPTVVVDEGLNHRRVDADLTVPVQTLFMNMLGVNEIPAPAAGAAAEGIFDLEISLVLDVSGSMNSNNRLNLLKDAAKSFVDAVIPQGAAEEDVSISIIPFATQVNAGALLLDQYNATSEHSYSHCVTFDSTDFNSASLSTTTQLKRTGHFAVWETSRTPSDDDFVCYPASHREILPWSHDPVALKAAIDAFQAGGNTSIDVGTKWGTALLDPGTQGVLTNLISSGDVHNDFSGRPYAYTEPNVIKVLVVMSDGQNTSQYYLHNDYRSGLSDVWLDVNGAGTSDDDWSQYDSYWNDYYHYDTGYYYSYPDGGSNANELNWPDVFENLSVYWWAKYLKVPAAGQSTSHWEDDAYTYYSGNTKNTRTSAICQQAKDAGILVFTIGMETYGQGDATLLDCASSAAHFFDVDGIEISEAFNAIAAKINQLKLVQ